MVCAIERTGARGHIEGVKDLERTVQSRGLVRCVPRHLSIEGEHDLVGLVLSILLWLQGFQLTVHGHPDHHWTSLRRGSRVAGVVVRRSVLIPSVLIARWVREHLRRKMVKDTPILAAVEAAQRSMKKGKSS